MADSPVKFFDPPGHRPAIGYTHAAIVPANARLLYVAGQGGSGPDGKIVGGGAFIPQAEQVFKNLENIITAAGGRMSDVIRTTVILTDRANVPAFRTVREKYFKPPMPTSTLIIADLIMADMLIEIEALVVLRD
jgi:enamine deaminase RidA (YjgF/YER057c/UK114 family)